MKNPSPLETLKLLEFELSALTDPKSWLFKNTTADEFTEKVHQIDQQIQILKDETYTPFRRTVGNYFEPEYYCKKNTLARRVQERSVLIKALSHCNEGKKRPAKRIAAKPKYAY